jgi:hypothetical protein
VLVKRLRLVQGYLRVLNERFLEVRPTPNKTPPLRIQLYQSCTNNTLHSGTAVHTQRHVINNFVKMELRGAALSSSTSARSKSQPPQKQVDEDPQSAHIRRILIKYLAEIEMETYNMAKEEHRNAAIALATRPKPILNKFDLEDPFKDMKPISIEGARPSKGANFFNIKAIHKKRGEVFVTVPEVPAEVPTDTPMFVKGRAYTTLRRNLITEDEPELSYQPYTEEGDLNEEEEFKKMEAQREESMRMECKFEVC